MSWRATPETVGPSGTGQRPKFPLPRSQKDTAFCFSEAAGTANWSPLLMTHLPELSQVKFSCLYTGGLCCPSLGPWQAQRFVLTAPSWISSRQIQSLTCGAKSPRKQLRLGTDRPSRTQRQARGSLGNKKLNMCLQWGYAVSEDCSELAKAQWFHGMDHSILVIIVKAAFQASRSFLSLWIQRKFW